ncbi:MAG TPA: AEC family transporter, partial [Aggregatilineales bacterium]|nr:AEC family transporter [Aggregatilineales bacterium]
PLIQMRLHMQELITTMFNVIAPILLIAGIGAYLGRRFILDRRTLSTVLIYFFIPALVIEGITNARVGNDQLIRMLLFIFIGCALLALVGWVIAKLLRLDFMTTNAFILCVVMLNAANYGIPFNKFAFGNSAEQLAVIYYVGSAIVSNTFGVYFASRGNSTSARGAMLNIFKVPLLYAMVIGLIFNQLGIYIYAPADMPNAPALPLPLARMIDIVSDAAVPGMLVLLGVLLAQSRFTFKRIMPMLVASGVKLLIAPFIAILVVALLGIEGLSRQVGIIQLSMPVAVLTSALAAQFDADIEFVTGVILISTLGSIVSLSLLVILVG